VAITIVQGKLHGYTRGPLDGALDPDARSMVAGQLLGVPSAVSARGGDWISKAILKDQALDRPLFDYSTIDKSHIAIRHHLILLLAGFMSHHDR
jgi:hypothetical protein